MPSYSFRSGVFDDPAALAADLTEGLPALPAEETIGFLTCDSQVDSQALMKALTDRVSFPVVGGTTMVYPFSTEEDEISASLVVLHKPGMRYAICVSEPLVQAECQAQMQALHAACEEQLGETPKLLMTFLPMMPGVLADAFIQCLFQEADGAPVFGGMTMGDLDSTKPYAYANGQVYGDRMVLIAFAGDIRPVFGVGSQLTVMADYSPAVTESEGNIVRRVDNMTFCDYMRSVGINPADRENGVDALMQYGPLPVRLAHKLEEDDGIPEIRCISYTSLHDESVAFSSVLPVGTRVTLGLLRKNDVTGSTHMAMQTLQQQMQAGVQDGYQYDMLFWIPCVARYFALVGTENAERRQMLDEMPKDMAISAYYAFCEIGPTVRLDGSIHNRSHNASVVLCAL